MDRLFVFPALRHPLLSMLSTKGLVIMTSCSSCWREGASPLAEGTMRSQGLLSSSGAVCVTVGTRSDSPWRASWRVRSSAGEVMTTVRVMISIMAFGFLPRGANSVPHSIPHTSAGWDIRKEPGNKPRLRPVRRCPATRAPGGCPARRACRAAGRRSSA